MAIGTTTYKIAESDGWVKVADGAAHAYIAVRGGFPCEVWAGVAAPDDADKGMFINGLELHVEGMAAGDQVYARCAGQNEFTEIAVITV